MRNIRLSKREIVIIDLLMFVLVLKLAYEPMVDGLAYYTQGLLERFLLAVWFVVGIILLSFCFINFFSALAIRSKMKGLDSKSSEYINKSQEYYIKLNNAKYFGKIFIFIYLLFNSMFVMGIFFLSYNIILAFIDIRRLKNLDETSTKYKDIKYNFDNEIKNMITYSIIANISLFYLRYSLVISQGNHYIRFLPGFIVVLMQALLYFLVIRKILKREKMKPITKYLIIIIYMIVFSLILLGIID